MPWLLSLMSHKHGIMGHAAILSTGEMEAENQKSRYSSATQQVGEYPGIQETVSQKKNPIISSILKNSVQLKGQISNIYTIKSIFFSPLKKF